MQSKIKFTSLVVVTAFFICGHSQAQPELNTASLQTILTSPKRAVISSPMAGTISQFDYKEGEKFKKNDTLLKFDCRIAQAQKEQSKAKLMAARTDFETKKKLKNLKSVSDLEYGLSQAEMLRAQAELEEYKVRIGLCAIKAPYDGIIVKRHVNAHETVNMSQPLFEIVSLDKLQAQILAPSDWLTWLNVGADLQIKMHENNQYYPAKIIRIGGEIDSVSRSILVVAELDGIYEELLPGMSGEAVFKKTPKEPVDNTSYEIDKDKSENPASPNLKPVDKTTSNHSDIFFSVERAAGNVQYADIFRSEQNVYDKILHGYKSIIDDLGFSNYGHQ